MIIDSSKINTTDGYGFLQSLDDQDNYVSWLGGTATSNPLVLGGTSNSFREDMQAGWGGARGSPPATSTAKRFPPAGSPSADSTSPP
jgi:hypothetical protein